MKVVTQNRKALLRRCVDYAHYARSNYHLQAKRTKYVGEHHKLKPWKELSESAKKDRMIWLYWKNAASAERLYRKYYSLMYPNGNQVKERRMHDLATNLAP